MLCQVAAETKDRAPCRSSKHASHGKDLRDYFNEGHTIDELLTLADATPALTLDDVKSKPLQMNSKKRMIHQSAIGAREEDENGELKDGRATPNV